MIPLLLSVGFVGFVVFTRNAYREAKGTSCLYPLAIVVCVALILLVDIALAGLGV